MAALLLAGCKDEAAPSQLPEQFLVSALLSTCPGAASVSDECPCRGVNAMAAESYGTTVCENAIEYGLVDSRELGLTYDGACASRLLELNAEHVGTTEVACSTTPSIEPWLACDDECQIFYGDGNEGDVCSRLGRRMSTCASDLVCGIDDVCHGPCDKPLEIPVGGPCGYFHDGVLDEQCAAGLVCAADTRTCEVPLSPGERCGDERPPCPTDHHCVLPTSTCEPRIAQGGACERHYDCVTLVCIDGVCAAPDPWSCEHPWY